MGWVDINDRMPPEGLQVLIEASGRYNAPYSLIADHAFFLGTWLVPNGETEGHWLIYDGTLEDDHHMIEPTVHAWMPLPKHYQENEVFEQEEDLMEHALFENDPDWLYKGDCVYEQMSLEAFMALKGETE